MRRRNRLTVVTQSFLASAALALGGCGSHAPASSAELAEVTLLAASIPSTGQCAHIVITRLADFQSREYRGLLSGATLQAPLGEDRVTATAYPPPCGTDPGAAAPWTADAQTVTLAAGPNTVTLAFHQTADVGVVPVFDDTSPLQVIDGSLVRIARNGEDTAGPNFAVDGWEVKQLTLPPAPVAETVLFSLAGKGMPYTPRGLAHTPDGNFVAQLGETTSPLFVFSGAGAPLDRWRVSYPAGTTQWVNTDGLEAIDATHFVRTGFANRPFDCDASGDHCHQSGLDILEKKTAADGTAYVEVTQQIFLPELPTESLNLEYPVGVTPVGPRFAVTVLRDEGGTALVLINRDGTVATGPTVIATANDIEGLFDDGAGRLVGLDYDGTLTTYSDTDMTPRAGETGNLGEGVGYAAPQRLTWRSANGSFIAYNGQRLVYAAPDFSSVTDIPIDYSSALTLPAGLEYRADTDELYLLDRYPVADPTVAAFNLTTNAQTSNVTLHTGLGVTLRPVGLTWLPARNQFVSHYRRTSGADATLDAVAWLHNPDGTLAGKFDLAPLGFVRINSVRYDAFNDQLIFVVVDTTGTIRLLTTDAFQPKRSYRTDALADLQDVALITSGPNAGDYGVALGQPSFFARIALP